MVNNPCPPGWRVPTAEELEAEMNSWDSKNSAGAFASPLKWPVGGYRSYTGSLTGVGNYGDVWSSSVSGSDARNLFFYEISNTTVGSGYRAYGMSVRCVRN